MIAKRLEFTSIHFHLNISDINIIAGWSSLEARRAHNPKVAGSNPAPAISPRQLSWQSRGLKILVSLVRFRFWAYGVLAQLVEHLTFNQVVRGSNPRCLIKQPLSWSMKAVFCCIGIRFYYEYKKKQNDYKLRFMISFYFFLLCK